MTARLLIAALAVLASAPIGCSLRAAPEVERASAERVFRRGAVAADHAVASQAGLEILKLGGNAVDAAVATSFCLSVVRPESCGIGGGGFMLIYDPPRGDGEAARAIAINYRETCPAAIGPDYYVKLNDRSASRFGVHAVGVPGTVAGLCHALRKYGTLDLPTVLAPAIRAAEHGFPADTTLIEAMSELDDDLRANRQRPGVARGNLGQEAGADDRGAGDVVRNPNQARALRLIAQHGPRAFYGGEIATAILKTMAAHGGPITANDLRGYQVRELQPLRGRFLDHTVLSMPPPSSGGIAMQQVFGILERRAAELRQCLHNDSEYAHLVAEAFKHAFADRSRWLADPAFVHVPVEKLLAPESLDRLASRIDLDQTRSWSQYGSKDEPAAAPLPDAGTSHFCVIDAEGMAVACTETINLSFGSLVEVPGFGFMLNNQMDDFTTIPGEANAFGLRQSERNLPEPGKRPLSSMSPTILLDEGGRAVLIAGASGGPRIITATTQCLLNSILFQMSPAEAVAAPRVHHQWLPDRLEFERRWRDDATMAYLQGKGHAVTLTSDGAAVQMIAVSADGMRAASDPRKGGTPAGY